MYETGVSLMRPMYYAFPNEPNAYLADQNGNFPQYMLGDDLIISPIVSPAFSNDTLARQTVWIPPGTWIEKISGQVISAPAGGLMYYFFVLFFCFSDFFGTRWNRAYDLSEIPIFVRAGAVIPLLPLRLGKTIGRASQQYNELEIHLALVPGVTSGSTVLYEDDGISTAYQTSQSWFKTSISFSRPSSNEISIDVAAPTGNGYPAFPAQRTYTFRYFGAPPASVEVNGNANSWTYDGSQMQVVIVTPLVSTSKPLNVLITVADPSLENAVYGVLGKIRRANLAKQTLDTSWSTPGAQIVQRARLSLVASSALSFSYLASNNSSSFSSALLAFQSLYAAAVSEILGLKPSSSFPENALVQWWSDQRQDSCLCATNECNDIQAQSGYKFVRIEGFRPSSSAPGTVRLFDYWNGNIMDNYATTNSSVPAGYTKAIFADGVVFAQRQPSGTVPLQTWWSAGRRDWLTVASEAGIAYANQNGYVLGNQQVGFVFNSQPLNVMDAVTTPTMAQWTRAYSLLVA